MNLPVFSCPQSFQPQSFQSPIAPSHSALARPLMVIDAAVADAQKLAMTLAEVAHVVMLDPERDGVVQLTEVIYQHDRLTSLHIIARGDRGCLYLGNTELSFWTLETYAVYIASWFMLQNQVAEEDSLPPCLYIHSGNVGTGKTGMEFVRKLHELTGATVIASPGL